MKNSVLAQSPKDDFNRMAEVIVSTKSRPAPFSLRLTAEERAYLEAKAGNQPLGGYIRSQLLGKMNTPRRSFRKPKTDEKQVAALLHELGQSRIPSNLNQLAKAANCGTLDVSEDVEEQLRMASAAVIAMREALFIALGLRSSPASPKGKDTADDTGR